MQYKPQDSFSSQFPPWLMVGGLTVALITGLMFPDWLQHVGVESDDWVRIEHPLQHLPVHRLQQPRGGQPQHQPPPQDHPRPAGQPWGHHEGLQDGSAKGVNKHWEHLYKLLKHLYLCLLGLNPSWNGFLILVRVHKSGHFYVTLLQKFTVK